MRARSFPSKSLQLSPFMIASAIAIMNGGCTVSTDKIEYRRGEEAEQKNQSDLALRHFEAIVKRSEKTPLAIQSAKEAAKILHYQLKRPREAVEYYKDVILYSPDPKERIDAQKNLADLHFNETLDYTQAISEYSRLLELPHTPEEDLKDRLAIARSYFYLNEFFQARVEIDTILNRGADANVVFDALLLKANILLTEKKLDEAISALNQLNAKFPQKSKAEMTGLTLAVCYEEKKDYAKAIETLKSIRNSYPRRAFIDQKIKTLQERQSLLPGARGLHK